jgi:hypothetical protein
LRAGMLSFQLFLFLFFQQQQIHLLKLANYKCEGQVQTDKYTF